MRISKAGVCRDERGFTMVELAMVILVLGIITGLVAVRQAVISELTEFANAVMSLNQSFSFSGQSNCLSSTAGSQAIDIISGTISEGSTPATLPSIINQAPCD